MTITMLLQNGQTPELGRDPSKFELLVNGHLRLKAYPNIALTNAWTGRPLALSTTAGQPGGSEAIKDLGFDGWHSWPDLPAQAAIALQETGKKLGLLPVP